MQQKGQPSAGLFVSAQTHQIFDTTSVAARCSFVAWTAQPVTVESHSGYVFTPSPLPERLFSVRSAGPEYRVGHPQRARKHSV
jgi:hypothetical protein